MQEQIFIFIKVSVGFTFHNPPCCEASQKKPGHSLSSAAMWLLTLCMLAFSALLLFLHFILSHTEGGKCICNEINVQWPSKEKVGANKRIHLFWIHSHAKGRGHEEFGEFSMKHWSWEGAEKKEEHSEAGMEKKAQTFFLALPTYHLESKQPSSSSHVTSIHKNPW